jgi:gluconolactonase
MKVRIGDGLPGSAGRDGRDDDTGVTMDNNIQPLNRREFCALSLAAGATLAAAGAHGAALGSITERYPDPRVKALDPRFSELVIGNTPLIRIATDNLWAEGTAWNSAGQFLVWSDIPADAQRRWLAEDGHVSTYRKPSGKSNGNTFDRECRQVSCQHYHRRVVRYELDGSETVLADAYNGKKLSAPNDVVVHPGDGSVWFTDPGYGLNWYEGQPGDAELAEAVYRIDAQSGGITLLTDECDKPNGLCFSPDYRKLYVADSGTPREIRVWDIDGIRLRNGRRFTSMELKGVGTGNADGIRADTQGNIWAGAGWVGEGYDGVHVFSPPGERIGMILLPEICANLCFGGAHGDLLFMAASQSVYALYVRAQGAHIA